MLNRTRHLLSSWQGVGGDRPYLRLIVLSVTVALAFSFLLFPRLINPLHVYYMKADGYYDIAEHLLSGKGFAMTEEPTRFAGAFKREPIYPLLMAATMRGGAFPVTMILMQVTFFAATTCAMYRLFSEFGRDRGLAFWSASLFAVFPFSYWYVAKPTPENITPLFLVVNVWLCRRYLRSPRGAAIALWGLSCALCALSKSHLVVLFPVGMLLVWIQGRRTRRLAAHSVLAVAVFAGGMAPWVVRNYRLSGRFIWGSSLAATSFFAGNRNATWDSVTDLGTYYRGELEMDHRWQVTYAAREAAAEEGGQRDRYVLEAETDADFSRMVAPWILDHKAEFGRKIIVNLATMWFMSNEKKKTMLLLICLAPLVAGALRGIWVRGRRGFSSLEKNLIAIMAVIYVCHSAILGYARYGHVLLPFACYFFVAGVSPHLSRAPCPERGSGSYSREAVS